MIKYFYRFLSKTNFWRHIIANFAELMQKYVNTDYSELVSQAREITPPLLEACKVIDKDNDGMVLLTSIILSAVAADGKLTAKEQQFLCDVLGIDTDTVEKLVGLHNGMEEDLTDKFADILPVEAKAAVLHLVTLIAACDETISREETAFIAKLIQ